MRPRPGRRNRSSCPPPKVVTGKERQRHPRREERPVRFAIKTRPEHTTWAQLREVWRAADDDLPPLRERFDRFDEGVESVVRLLSQETTTFGGRYVRHRPGPLASRQRGRDRFAVLRSGPAGGRGRRPKHVPAHLGRLEREKPGAAGGGLPARPQRLHQPP